MEHQQSMQEQYLAVIKQIIEDNIDNESFSVADLAREAGLSRSMLHRRLIKLTGKSATDLITEIRLKKAFELLENDAGTVSEIAYLVGYSSPSYFNKVFRKTYKVSPGDVRRKGKGKTPHLRVVKEPGVPVSARSKKPGFKVIPITNILMIIIVTLGALALILGVMGGVSSILRLPEWIIYLVLLILGVGIIIASILYWIYDIRREGGILKTDSAELAESENIPRSSKLRKIATYISMLVIFGLVLFILYQRSLISRNLRNLDKSIAVLPFEIWNSAEEFLYLGDAIASEITTQLAKIKEFQVTSFTSSSQFKGQDNPSISDIGRVLGVKIIIVGSLERQEEDFSIQVQAIRAGSDEILWAEVFNFKWEDIFEIRSNITISIAEGLKIALSPEEKEQFLSAGTQNPEAYNYYLKGNYLYNQLTPDSFWKAIDLYQKAIALDSKFAEAYCNLAFTYFSLMGWFATPSIDYIPIVKSNLLKVLELDNELGEAYYMLGDMNYLYEWDWDEAEKNFKKGLELNPNYTWGRIEYANFLTSMRRFDESIRLTKRTIELDPLSPLVYNELSYGLWNAGKSEQALEVLDTCLILDPNHLQTLWGSMDLNTELGNYNRALSILEKLKGNNEIIEIPPYLLAHAGKLMVYLGRREEAITYLNELNRRADEEGYKDTVPQALIYIALGEHEKALDLLEQAFMNRNFAMAQMNTHKGFDPLRSYDRFQNIMKKMNFP